MYRTELYLSDMFGSFCNTIF